MTALIVTLCIILLLIALWLVGSAVRQSWQAVPSWVPYVDYDRLGRSPTAFVVVSGAWNRASVSTDRLAGDMHQYGDVYFVDYPLKRFDMATTVNLIVHRLRDPAFNYDRVVLVGSSLGGIICLRAFRLLERFREYGPKTICIWGISVPQCGDHLKQKQLATVGKYIRPGPILNVLLTKPLQALSLKPVAPELIGRETNWVDFQRHHAAMRKHKASAMLEQPAAIVSNTMDYHSSFIGVPSVYLYSPVDDVIHNEPACHEWAKLFRLTDENTICVEGTFHWSVTEHYNRWAHAIHQAACKSGLKVIR